MKPIIQQANSFAAAYWEIVTGKLRCGICERTTLALMLPLFPAIWLGAVIACTLARLP